MFMGLYSFTKGNTILWEDIPIVSAILKRSINTMVIQVQVEKNLGPLVCVWFWSTDTIPWVNTMGVVNNMSQCLYHEAQYIIWVLAKNINQYLYLSPEILFAEKKYKLQINRHTNYRSTNYRNSNSGKQKYKLQK